MKWIITIVSMTAVAALVVGGAQAGGSSSGDFLVGAAERPAVGVPGVFVQPVVAALSGPNGENASGFFWLEGVENGVPRPFSGTITCLRVEGNRAVAGGVVTRSELTNAPVGSGALIQVTDHGSPGAGRDTNVNFIGYGGSDPELTTCPSNDFPEITITKGNFAVRDE